MTHEIQHTSDLNNACYVDICTDTWTGLSIATADFDSIATPVTTQDCLWRIFETDTSTGDICDVKAPEPPAPPPAPKTRLAGLFRARLNLQKQWRGFACFGGGIIKRKESTEYPKRFMSRENQPCSTSAGGELGGCKKEAVNCGRGRLSILRRGQGHSCGVKE